MIINGKRALAYTAKITNIKPIEGADRIELAQVNEGWWSIVNKSDHFHIGDTCIFFEIDSRLPSKDKRFAFLKDRKYKVKTFKLKKFNVISQGLIMPIALFNMKYDTEPGIDLTDKLHVTNYTVKMTEEEELAAEIRRSRIMSMRSRHKELAKKKWWKWLMKRNWGIDLLLLFFGKKKIKPGKFPTKFHYVTRTDEDRVECMTWILENKEPFIITEKLDGSSSTYILERKHGKFNFYVCSRNIQQFTPDQECFHGYNIYWDMAFKYDIENKLKVYLEENPRLKYVCIQGESVGNVQGNPLGLEEDDLYVFNFIRSDLGRLSLTTGKEIIESWGMKWVPILDTNYILPDTLEELKEYTHGYSVVNPNVLREGIVCRQDDISFKSVDIEFLLWKEQFYDFEK